MTGHGKAKVRHVGGWASRTILEAVSRERTCPDQCFLVFMHMEQLQVDLMH